MVDYVLCQHHWLCVHICILQAASNNWAQYRVWDHFNKQPPALPAVILVTHKLNLRMVEVYYQGYIIARVNLLLFTLDNSYYYILLAKHNFAISKCILACEINNEGIKPPSEI